MTNITPKLSDLIVHETCGNFRFIEGGTLILYLSKKDSDVNVRRLWIDCAWRLCQENKILVGSLDDSEAVLKMLPKINGDIVESVSVSKTFDLILSFHSGISIETFGYSVSDELWELRCDDGLRIGTGPRFELYERYEEPDNTEK